MRVRAGMSVVLLVVCASLAGCRATSVPIADAEVFRVGSEPVAPARQFAAVLPDVRTSSRLMATDDAEADVYTDTFRVGEASGEVRFERRRSDGSLVLERMLLVEPGSHRMTLVEERNHVERVDVVYDPPVVVWSGGSFEEQTVEMTVYVMGSRTRVRARGPATRTIEPRGMYELRSVLGARTVLRVDMLLEVAFPLARVRNAAEQWWDPELGLIGERTHEVTRALLPRDKRDAWYATDVQISD